jgi:hypothetical protein
MPGWVFLFGIGVLQSVQNICVFGSVESAIGHSALAQLTTGAAAVLIGSGVPLGFLIYQLYYESYDHWMPFSLAPQDRGGDILKGLPEQVLTELRAYETRLNICEMCDFSTNPLLVSVFGQHLRRLKPEFRNRKGKRAYRHKRQVNFEAIRFYLTVISTSVESDNFRNEYTNLSDIYNAIGACRTALLLSFFLYVLYNILSPAHRSALIASRMIPLLVNLAIFGFVIAIIQSRRTRLGTACQAMLSNSAYWYAAQRNSLRITKAKSS